MVEILGGLLLSVVQVADVFLSSRSVALCVLINSDM